MGRLMKTLELHYQSNNPVCENISITEVFGEPVKQTDRKIVPYFI